MGRKAILISGVNRSISSELYIIVSENMESYVKNNKKVSKLILLALSMIKDILKRNKEKSLVILHIDYRTYVLYNDTMIVRTQSSGRRFWRWKNYWM